MNPLSHIRGQSTQQNNLDHQFDPLAAKPKANSGWIAENPPKNYVQQKGDDEFQSLPASEKSGKGNQRHGFLSADRNGVTTGTGAQPV